MAGYTVLVVLFALALTVSAGTMLFRNGVHPLVATGMIVSASGIIISAVLLCKKGSRLEREKMTHARTLSDVSGLYYWTYLFDTNTFKTEDIREAMPDFHPSHFETPNDFFNAMDVSHRSDVVQCFTGEADAVSALVCRFNVSPENFKFLECDGKPLIVNGKQIGRHGTIRNATSLNVHKQMLQKKLEKTEKALHLAQMFEWEIDLESRKIHILSPFSTILFLEPGKQTFTLDEFFSRIDQASRSKAMHFLMNQDAIDELSLEFRFNRVDGEVFYLRMYGTGIQEVSGKKGHRFGIAQDISGLREAELALEESEKEKNFVVDNIPTGLALWTPDRRLVWANQKLYELFGKSRSSEDRDEICYRILGRSCDLCDICPVPEAIQQRRPVTQELEYKDKTLSITAVPFIDSYSEIDRVITIVNDVSLEKQLQNQLIHSHKMEAIGGLAAGIAQDFNNAFHVIWNCVEGALEVCDETAQARLNPVIDVIKNGHELVNQLLSFSGKETIFKPVKLDIKAFVEHYSQKLKSSVANTVTVSVSINDNVQEIFSDTKILENILNNITDNAIEAIPDAGHIELHVIKKDLPPEMSVYNKNVPFREYICLTVSDNGIGIPETDINRVFNPFYTTKYSSGSSGAGLSNVYANIRRHHGFIRINSVENKGTDVELYFPVFDTLDIDTRELLTAIRANTKTDTVTILLVDDDPTVRKVNQKTLENHGYNVMEVADGQSAIDVFSSHADSIHLVILDLVLPRRSGHEVYECIMKNRPEMKVIFATGYSDEYLENLPSDAIIMQKPFSKKDLLDTVKIALVKNRN